MRTAIKYLKAFKAIIFKIFFFCLNFYCLFKVKRIIPSVREGIIFSGLESNNLQEFIKIYEDLNKPQKMNFINLLLLRIFGSRSCFLAKDLASDKIVAIDFFYFNWRDFYEKSIHEAFIGVIEAYRGKGIATDIRKYALLHFSGSNILAVSTRISKNNFASFSSAKKLGFEVEEEYFDVSSNEERAYLKRSLKPFKVNRN